MFIRKGNVFTRNDDLKSSTEAFNNALTLLQDSKLDDHEKEKQVLQLKKFIINNELKELG